MGLILFLPWILALQGVISRDELSDLTGSLGASVVSMVATVVGFYFAKNN